MNTLMVIAYRVIIVLGLQTSGPYAKYLSIFVPLSQLFVMLILLTLILLLPVIGSSYYWAWLDTVWWASIWFCEHKLQLFFFGLTVPLTHAILNLIFSCWICHFWFQFNVLGQSLGFLGSCLYAYYKLQGK